MKDKQLDLMTQSDNLLSNLEKKDKINKSQTRDMLFDNLISVEELAVIFRLAPQTIRNWIALKKIPYVQIGRKKFFRERSLEKWLNQKEKPHGNN